MWVQNVKGDGDVDDDGGLRNASIVRYLWERRETVRYFMAPLRA